MTRKIDRGKALTELVKGSLDYTQYLIRAAFRRQFPITTEDESFFIEESFDDHVIVWHSALRRDEFYYVTFEKSGNDYVFAARETWEVVELTYQPQRVFEERRGKVRKGRFNERITQAVNLIEADGVAGRIKAIGITADVVNGNKRRYPAPVLAAAVEELKTHLHESAGQGRMMLLGEAEHPNDKPSRRPNLLETVVKWDSVAFDGTQVLLEGQILKTSKGKDILAILSGGILPGVSQRAYGFSEPVQENGEQIEEITALHITGYDLVLSPSDPAGAVTMVETKNDNSQEENQMGQLDLNKLRNEYPDLVMQIEREHDEKERKKLEEALKARQAEDARIQNEVAEREKAMREALGLSETDDLQQALAERQQRLAELEEAEKQREIATYIDKEADGVKYPDFLKAQFVEAVKATQPGSVDEAKQTLIAKRKEYDTIMSGLELATKGYGGVQVLGPVLERETGVPEFARAGFEITEALVRTGQIQKRDMRQPKTINERFAAEYLKRFDERYKPYLQQEARLFAEAESTTDLNLPYSVARAVVGEVWPRLVATSVFDIGMAGGSPMNIFYEKYVGETGSTASVTNEAVTMTALDTWYDLANEHVQPGTVVVQDSTDTTTYTEGTDYVVDYIHGKILALTGGAITGGAVLHVDYTYDAIGKGELAAIERAKIQLSSQVLTCTADRLAAQITREAVVFSRSQLGWDATTRTLMALVQQIRRLIDKGLFYNALTAALQVANNSGGTWTSATDPLLDLVEKVGVARVKVAARYYQPTALVMSVTNSDRIANWDGFTAAGSRADAAMDANGYVGRLKGLPVFETTEFPDNYILAANREVVMHRILEPMILKGPFPTYSGDKLVAAEQYYVEEFNGTIMPVPEKAAYVKIV